MEKRKKEIDVWVASDNTEHLTPSACEIHEEKLLEQKAHTKTQEMCLATDRWLAANREEWSKREREMLGIDEFNRTPAQRSLDEEMGFEPLSLDTPDRDKVIHARFGAWMIARGYWAGMKPNGDPVPMPKIVKISELEEGEILMAHIVHNRLGLFPSVSEAKKNGWGKPVQEGDYWLNKKTIHLKVIP